MIRSFRSLAFVCGLVLMSEPLVINTYAAEKGTKDTTAQKQTGKIGTTPNKSSTSTTILRNPQAQIEAPVAPAPLNKATSENSEVTDGTDFVPVDAQKTDEKEQEMPNSADVPKSVETTEDLTDVQGETPSNKLPFGTADDPFALDAETDTKAPATTRKSELRETPVKEIKVLDEQPQAKTTIGGPVKFVDETNVSPGNSAAEETLSPEMLKLRSKVRHCLQVYYHEPMTTMEYSPWGIMHALIAYGVDTEVHTPDRKVNAIGWLCYNGSCRGMQMMYTENGKLRMRIGPGYQGHAGQFLAMLAQSRVKKDFPIKVDGHNFTVADLIEYEKQTCRVRSELTFKLIALSHYLDLDEKWKSDIGEDWDIPKLIKEELAQTIVGAACGGTHRMTGFSYAVNRRTKVGGEFDGQWLRAQKFVNAYHDYIFTLQNQDGSFSTNWFQGRGEWGDLDRRVQTTGHMLEWLACSVSKEQLDDPRVTKAVDYLVNILEDGARVRKKWEVGPRGHAIHALAIYDERRFNDKAGQRDEVLAKRPVNRTVLGPDKPQAR